MPRVTITGPDGQPEEVHLTREEDPIDRMTAENAARADTIQRKNRTTWWWRILGGGAAGAFLWWGIDAGYFLPLKPWPEWLAAGFVVALIIAIGAGAFSRKS